MSYSLLVTRETRSPSPGRSNLPTRLRVGNRWSAPLDDSCVEWREPKMAWLRILFTRLLTMFHKEHQQQELNEEVESHLEMLADEKRSQGMSATEARNAALREFGAVSQMREKYREMSGLKAVEILGQDL